MALQRINQELEDKLYRMVRASPRGHPAPPALGPQLWNVEGGCQPGWHPVALVELSHRPCSHAPTPPPTRGWAGPTISTPKDALKTWKV